jgi:tRNA 2-thiouridine synthesizing protein A
MDMDTDTDTDILPDIVVDVMGETCPIPLVEMRKAVMRAQKSQVIEVRGSHPASKKEIPMAVNSLNLELLAVTDEPDGSWRIFIKK